MSHIKVKVITEHLSSLKLGASQWALVQLEWLFKPWGFIGFYTCTIGDIFMDLDTTQKQTTTRELKVENQSVLGPHPLPWLMCLFACILLLLIT